MEDRFFDLVYAFSVFTHIDEWETAWLAELRRVLKPGGVAYLTIHSDQGWLNMGPKFPIFNGLMQLRDLMPEYGISEEMFRSPMPEPRLVFKMGRQPGHGCNVFHSHAYVHDVWGRYFDVVRIVENPVDPQAGVLLRRQGR
jgi:SAM-dependent methyltransferase